MSTVGVGYRPETSSSYTVHRAARPQRRSGCEVPLVGRFGGYCKAQLRGQGRSGAGGFETGRVGALSASGWSFNIGVGCSDRDLSFSPAVGCRGGDCLMKELSVASLEMGRGVFHELREVSGQQKSGCSQL